MELNLVMALQSSRKQTSRTKSFEIHSAHEDRAPTEHYV